MHFLLARVVQRGPNQLNAAGVLKLHGAFDATAAFVHQDAQDCGDAG